jgi:hypothetical protein
MHPRNVRAWRLRSRTLDLSGNRRAKRTDRLVAEAVRICGDVDLTLVMAVSQR